MNQQWLVPTAAVANTHQALSSHFTEGDTEASERSKHLLFNGTQAVNSEIPTLLTMAHYSSSLKKIIDTNMGGGGTQTITDKKQATYRMTGIVQRLSTSLTISRGHRAMPGTSVFVTTGDRSSWHRCVRARDAAQHPPVPRTAFPKQKIFWPKPVWLSG